MAKVCWLHLEIFLGNLLNTHCEHKAGLTSAHPALLVSDCAVLKRHQECKISGGIFLGVRALEGMDGSSQAADARQPKSFKELGPAPAVGQHRSVHGGKCHLAALD